MKNLPNLFILCRCWNSGRHTEKHHFTVANMGLSSRRRTETWWRIVTSSSPSARSSGLLSLIAPILPMAPVSSLTATPGAGATWRRCPTVHSPCKLHRTVLSRVTSSFLQSAASRMIGVSISYNHSAELLGGPMVTSFLCTAARAPRSAVGHKHVLDLPLRKPISSKNPPSSRSQFCAVSRVP